MSRFPLSWCVLGAMLSGCAITEPVGGPLPQPDMAPGIAIGRSTEADLIAVYGQPARRTETGTSLPADPKQAASFHPTTETTLVFRNGEKVVIAYAKPYGTTLRSLTFRLHDGVLAGYAFASPFAADTPPLDADAAAAVLKRPDATLADLVAAIGSPQSRQTYPAGIGPIYEVASWAGAVRNPAGRVTKTDNLTVTFTKDGRILRHTLNDNQANP